MPSRSRRSAPWARNAFPRCSSRRADRELHPGARAVRALTLLREVGSLGYLRSCVHPSFAIRRNAILTCMPCALIGCSLLVSVDGLSGGIGDAGSIEAGLDVLDVVDAKDHSDANDVIDPVDPIGCSDQHREAFTDLVAFSRIAGCKASWNGRVSLRRLGTGTACGNDLGPCDAPADACSPEWHVCGSNGNADELVLVGITAAQCRSAGSGAFSAAVSHCHAQGETCEYDATGQAGCLERGTCAEPICCGSECSLGSCQSAIWEDQTRKAGYTDEGCGSIRATTAGGVLCCR